MQDIMTDRQGFDSPSPGVSEIFKDAAASPMSSPLQTVIISSPVNHEQSFVF